MGVATYQGNMHSSYRRGYNEGDTGGDTGGGAMKGGTGWSAMKKIDKG